MPEKSSRSARASFSVPRAIFRRLSVHPDHPYLIIGSHRVNAPRKRAPRALMGKGEQVRWGRGGLVRLTKAKPRAVRAVLTPLVTPRTKRPQGRDSDDRFASKQVESGAERLGDRGGRDGQEAREQFCGPAEDLRQTRRRRSARRRRLRSARSPRSCTRYSRMNSGHASRPICGSSEW